MNVANTAITGLAPEEHGHRGLSPVRFVFVFVVLYTATVLLPEQVLAPLNRLFASGAALLLEAWGLHASLQGDILIAGGFHARVIDECTPLFMLIMFAAFLAACPARLERKGKALLLATLFFSCLTVLRIAFLVFVGANYPAQFQFVHAYLAQSLMVLAVILAAVVWLRWERTGVSDLPILGFFSRFILWSSFLFFAWLPLNKIYMQQLDHLLAALFSLAGRQLLIPHGHAVYFQTFNLVTFGGLMLASRAPAGPHDRRNLLAGLALLVFGHLLVRFGNIMATAFSIPWGFPFATSISIASQYLAPFLLWWIMVMNRNKEQTV
jgi:exosortase/archaeosortase family protein